LTGKNQKGTGEPLVCNKFPCCATTAHDKMAQAEGKRGKKGGGERGKVPRREGEGEGGTGKYKLTSVDLIQLFTDKTAKKEKKKKGRDGKRKS